MQDPPSLVELLESVRHFLEKEAAPAAADARARFRTLVAANVLAVAAREAAGEDALLEEESRRLELLLGPAAATPGAGEGEGGTGGALRARVQAANDLLARRIRAGEIDAGPGSPVWEHLRQTVLEKLRVANPGYLERASRGGGEGAR
jgi:hypothetical protein